MTKRATAAGYIRVSDTRGREGDAFLSPDVQRDKIEAWAAFRGYAIADWYIDLDVSGRTMDRPEFERLMSDAKAGRFEAVAVYRLTRFARSIRGAATAIEDLERHGVALVSVTEDLDTGTVAGKLLRNILLALAEFESDRIGEEWRNVHLNRRRRGIAHVARPMYGYRIDGAEIVDVERKEAEGVRLAFKLRAEGSGYGAIRKALHEAGHRPKHGGSYFPISSLRDILRNPLYAGVLALTDGEEIEARHEALITREQFETVQAMRQRVSSLSRATGGLLSGLAICAGCGGRLRYERRGGVAMYRCRSRQRATERCEAPATINAAAAEEYVDGLFFRRLSVTQLPNGGRIAPGATKQKQREKEAAALRARADELTAALSRLAELRFVGGSLEEAEYRRQFGEWVAERAEAVERAQALEDETKRARAVPPQQALDLYPSLPMEEKRKLIRMVIDSVSVKKRDQKGGGRWHGSQADERLEVNWAA